MKQIDLHIHTEHSMDGDRSVSSILDACAAADISTIALTDHNSTQAVSEALELGAAAGIEIIPGIEIDTVYGGTVFHLLGYYVDHSSPDFPELCLQAEKAELDSFPAIIEKLQARGLEISMDALIAEAAGGRPTEEMLARLTVDNPRNHGRVLMAPYLDGGERADMPVFNFYYDFMAPGKEAFTLRNYIALEDAVALVRDNGGVPIIAHPGPNLKGHADLLDGLLRSGIRGFEAFSSYHDDATCRQYAEIADQNRMLATCGSDFHGSLKPGIVLGGHGCDRDQAGMLPALRAAAR